MDKGRIQSKVCSQLLSDKLQICFVYSGIYNIPTFIIRNEVFKNTSTRFLLSRINVLMFIYIREKEKHERLK